MSRNTESFYQTLFEYIEKFTPINDETKADIKRTFKPAFVTKGTILEAEGKIPQFHNFIVSGYMRMFHIDENANEITTNLNTGSQFFTSYQAFINQTISNEAIHCLTDCELLRINFEDAKRTNERSEAAKMFTIKLFEKLLADEKQRIWEMANLSAEKRYQKFATENPQLLLHVNLGYVASFLGITQRHLSRIRKG